MVIMDILHFSGGQVSVSHDIKEDDQTTDTLFNTLKQDFPWITKAEYRGISDVYQHEYTKTNVVRTCLYVTIAENLLGKKIGTAHRLFDVDNKTSCLYATVLYEGERPSWAIGDMFVMGYTEHHEELGKPCSPELLNFKEYFFTASEETLQQLGIDTTNINEDTIYSVVVADNEIVSARKYTDFLEEEDEFSWQLLYIMFAKKARRMDLVRELVNRT
jgi:hypothetical protein